MQRHVFTPDNKCLQYLLASQLELMLELHICIPNLCKINHEMEMFRFILKLWLTSKNTLNWFLGNTNEIVISLNRITISLNSIIASLGDERKTPLLFLGFNCLFCWIISLILHQNHNLPYIAIEHYIIFYFVTYMCYLYSFSVCFMYFV